MQTVYEQIVNIVGEVPVGLEPVVYMVSLLVLLFLLSAGFRILWAVLNWVGGR